MKKSVIAVLLLVAVSLATGPSWGQEPSEDSESEARRQARIEALKNMPPEEREARRTEMRQRYQNMSDEERAAAQERRQARLEKHGREHRALRRGKRSAAGPSTSAENASEELN